MRILAGTGRGQVRRVSSNTATVLTIDTPWDTTPDSSSRFIVEAPAWEYFAEGTPTSNSDPALEANIQAPVDNLLEQVILVQGVAVDTGGAESPDELSPVREIYLFGDTGTIGDVAEVQIAHA